MLKLVLVSCLEDGLSKKICEVFTLNKWLVFKCFGLIQEKVHFSLGDSLFEV